MFQRFDSTSNWIGSGQGGPQLQISAGPHSRKLPLTGKAALAAIGRLPNGRARHQ
jgi:hypothetical protein